jgi:hypothetical protein
MRHLGGSSWTPDRKEAALKMWRDGKSAAAIAREIGGVSRSAVIGMITRANAQRGGGALPVPPDPCARFGDADLLAALRMQAAGQSVRAVAQRLGIGWQTARDVLDRLGADYRESLV